MNQENIDIIIPIYNAEKTIAETLQSIIMQSYTSWRVIIIDDGSIDKSVDIVKKYMKKDSRIEYFYKENGGINEICDPWKYINCEIKGYQ